MGRRQWVAASLALASVAFSLCIVWSAHAQGGSLTLVPNTVNMFRDTRGPNNVGVTPGDFFQYGADIQGGSAGGRASAPCTRPPGLRIRRFRVRPWPSMQGSAPTPRRSTPARIATVELTSTRGDDELIVSGPDLTVNDNAILNPVPFATSFGFTAGPTPVTPTLTWIIPAGFVPDGMRINVRDKDDVLGNGTANVIHSVSVAPTATSYSIPAVLTSGRTLSVEGNYAVDFQLVETQQPRPVHELERRDPAAILLRIRLHAKDPDRHGDQHADVPRAETVDVIINGTNFQSGASADFGPSAGASTRSPS